MRIFEGKGKHKSLLHETIFKNIQEMVLTSPQFCEDGEMDEPEASILKKIDISPNMCVFIPAKKNGCKDNSYSFFMHIPTHFIQLSFNGASNGNPGIAGCGGIIRDGNSEPVHVYAFLCGIATNNLEEFMTLEICLQIAIIEVFCLIQVHGDSQLVIQIVCKLIQGLRMGKLIHRCHLHEVVSNIKVLLEHFDYVISIHTWQEGNKVVYVVANWSYSNKHVALDEPWSMMSRRKDASALNRCIG